MDRASVFGTEGWGFESLRVHLVYRSRSLSVVLPRNPEQPKGIDSVPPSLTRLLDSMLRLASFDSPATDRTGRHLHANSRRDT